MGQLAGCATTMGQRTNEGRSTPKPCTQNGADAMRAESWLLAVTIVMIDGGWTALTWRMWSFRDRFEIAARAPALVCVSQLVGIIMATSILVNWLLLAEGEGIPCSVNMVVIFVGESVVGDVHRRRHGGSDRPEVHSNYSSWQLLDPISPGLKSVVQRHVVSSVPWT